VSTPGDPLLVGALTAEAGAAASALLVLALAARPWRGRAETTRAWGPPVALAAGTASGFLMTRGAPAFPPAQAAHWLFYAALASGALGALEALRGRRVLLARALFAVLLPLWMLEFQRTRYWTRAEGILWTAGLAMLLVVAWNALAALEERARGATALGLALATALAAASYGLSGGAIFAQLTGALALALGICALLGLWRRAPGLGRGGVAPYVSLHYAMLWYARWVNELSTPGFALLALVPLAALAARLVPRERYRLRASAALLAPALLAGGALAVEIASIPPPYG
jgi:hypothetical protein